MSRVLFITRVVQTYREPFHTLVREKLSQVGVEYQVAHGEAEDIHKAKSDVVTLSWAHVFKTQAITVGKATLYWQPLLRLAKGADLIIVGQENKFALNYILQVGRRFLFGKVALWGHGRNFQARDKSSIAERWKASWTTQCDWWFAYTEESRKHIESLGFPSKKITVFNNTIDTYAFRNQVDQTSDIALTNIRQHFNIKATNVGVFVGGLYAEKRLSFLIDACDLVRTKVSDFELIVIGGGQDDVELKELAHSRPWIIVAGPRFGCEKAALMRLAKVFLMPGLVGLAVLDAGIARLPTVTTAYPWHSPEIAYLEDGKTGVIVPNWQSASCYADAVVSLLQDEETRSSMALAARYTAETYTIEDMAERFTNGVLAALEA